MPEPEPIEVGQVWRHKGDRYRRVEVTSVDAANERVGVKRNTSRRRQPIGFGTLRREYRLVP